MSRSGILFAVSGVVSLVLGGCSLLAEPNAFVMDLPTVGANTYERQTKNLARVYYLCHKPEATEEEIRTAAARHCADLGMAWVPIQHNSFFCPLTAREGMRFGCYNPDTGSPIR